MRRALACAAAVAALAVPAAALAATKTYTGGIKGDQETSVTLKVKQGDDGRQMKSFVGKDLLISCEGDVGARLKSAKITGLVDVNDAGKFHVNGSNGGQELKVAGKLSGKHNAKGTVRYSGPTDVDGEVLDCDSGKLDWTASR